MMLDAACYIIIYKELLSSSGHMTVVEGWFNKAENIRSRSSTSFPCVHNLLQITLSLSESH